MRPVDAAGETVEGFLLASRAVNLLLAGMAISMIVLFLYVALRRIGFPYELEWMEGGVVDHAARILDGHQPYAEPSPSFIAYTYTPLYFYAGALSAKLFGVGYFALRLISLASTLGSLVLIFLFVRRESGSSFFGLLGAGIFAAGFGITGYWYDLARPDMLFIVLLLASAYLLRFHNESRYLFIAGLIAFLAFIAKQTTLFVAIPLASYCLGYLPGWKKAIFPATLLGGIGLSTLVLNLASGSWYYFYVFQLPRYHGIISKNYDDFPHFIYLLSIATAFALLFIGFLFFKRQYRRLAFYGLLLAGTLFASWVVSIREGSYLNIFIPAAAGIAICAALGVEALTAEIARRRQTGCRQSLAAPGALLSLAALLLCGFQFTTLYYSPGDQIPTEANRRAGDELVSQLRQVDGEPFVIFHGFLARQAGKEPAAQGVAIGDVLQSGRPEATRLRRQIDQAIRDGQYSALVIDEALDQELTAWLGLGPGTAASLSCRAVQYQAGDFFFQATGMKTRPLNICGRR